MKTKIKTLLLTMTLLLGIVLPIVFQVGVVHADIEPDHQHFQFHKVDATDTDPDTQWPYILNDGSLTPYDDIAKGPLGATYLADYKFTAFTITDLFYDLLNGVVEFDWVGPPVPANIYQVKKIISPGSGTAYPGGRSKLYEDLEAFLTQFKTVDEFIAAIPPGTKTTPAIETTATDAVADRSLSAGGVVELPTQTTTYPARNHVYAVFETTTPPGVAVLKSIPMLIMMPIVDGSGKNLELVHVFPKNIVEDGGGKDIISPKVNGYNIGDLISYNLWVTVPDDFTQTINVNGTKVWKYDTITMTDTFGAGLEFVSWDFVWVGNSSDQIPVLPAHDSKVDKLSANITPLVNSIRKDSAPIPAGFEATIDTIGKSPISSPVLITITPDNVNNDPNGSLYTDESMNHRLSLVGKRINVVITFKITDAAIPVAGVLENEITYEFSNEDDPVITGPTGTFPAEDAFVGGYLFAKNSEDSPYEYIEKAEFQIFRSQANANTGDNPLLFFVQTISGTEYYYALNEDEYADYMADPKTGVFGVGGKYEGQTPLDTLISDANGFFKVINLLLTDYWIVETKAPSRYTAFINPIKFTVSKGDSLASPAIPTTLANSDNYGAWENGLVSLVDDDDEDLIKTDLHHNIPNAVGDGELPATGGRGFWYILLASLVAFTIMATFYFIRRKAQVVHEDRHDDV